MSFRRAVPVNHRKVHEKYRREAGRLGGNAAPALAAANAARKARRSMFISFLPVVGNGPLREVS